MRNAVRGLFIAGAIFGLANAAHADDGFCFYQYAQYLKYLQNTTSRAAGSAVVIFKLGEQPCLFFSGVTDVNAHKAQPIDANTVFELASVTKVFTTAILGMHVPFGLDVYAPVKPYLPPKYDLIPEHNEEGVTFQQLATFTGGFWWSDPPGFTPGQTFTQEAFVDAVNDLDPTAPEGPEGIGFPGPIPGEQYLPTYQQYSNGSVGFLGQILMHMDSKKGQQYPFDANGFSNWIADNLTGPLNMPNTRVHPGGTLATGYKLNSKGKFVVPVDSPFPWVPWGAAGALRSTAADMLTFLEANICAHHQSDPACASFPSYVLDALATAHNANDYQPKGTLVEANIFLGGCGSQKEQAWAWVYVAPPEPNPNNVKPIMFKGGSHPGFGSFIGLSPDKSYGLVVLLSTGHLGGLDPASLNMIQNTHWPLP